MLLTFCLMFGILAAGPDGTPAGAPLEPAVRMLRPVIIRESNASRIAVLHKGKLRETGTHQELLAARGIYWKLYLLQYKDQEARLRTT